MSSGIYIRKGANGICRICSKRIEKNQIQINFRGWNASAVIHSRPEDCKLEERIKVEEIGNEEGGDKNESN